MTQKDIDAAIDAYAQAARSAREIGFDGVELHGAHGYLICEFLSPEINRRNDEYGGPLENRARFLFEAIDGVRAVCRQDFSLGVRLSPERFGMQLLEIRTVAARLLAEAKIDYLDMSLWDCFKEPEDPALRGRNLMSFFTDLPRGAVRLGAAGKIVSGADAAKVIDAGMDFVVIGRSAVLHHDFARRVAADPAFEPAPIPVSPEYLRSEGLSDTFIKYMRHWKGFVTDPVEDPASVS
jgi:2,4-dienoyl-CoA reductase-like NADH-dependent reductase (Old Yellow Enzyme family)